MQASKTMAKIIAMAPLTNTILQVKLEPYTYIHYEAGQYLQIHTDNGPISYSIANAPLGAHFYELHIRHSQDNQTTVDLLSLMKRKGCLELELPLGECTLSHLQADKPIIFVAAGTGFAPIKAMIEELLAQGGNRPFELYWGARTQSDLYLDEHVLNWQNHVGHFRYYSLISGEHKLNLMDALKQRHINDICDYQFVMNGPFEMVYALRDALMGVGVARSAMYSDAFLFE